MFNRIAAAMALELTYQSWRWRWLNARRPSIYDLGPTRAYWFAGFAWDGMPTRRIESADLYEAALGRF